MNVQTTSTMVAEYHFLAFNKMISTDINVLLHELYVRG